MPHQLTFKPSFLNELNALDRGDVGQVTKKLELLANDPRPDAKVKKQLKHMGGELHRLRAGDFRIFYTFDRSFVSLLSVKKRDESTYADDVDAEFLGGPSDARPVAAAPAASWDAWLAPPPKTGTPLARAIDDALLESLAIPVPFRAALLAAATEEDLLEAPVPQDLLGRVIDALVGRPEQELARQPDLILDDAADLLRFREGDLLGFLLRLDTEQEKLVGWGVKSESPTLLKGGPGSGKSTVAIYRARAMIAALRKAGTAEPRLLFTTYTRALARVSEQLLGRLLGADARLVEVRTADAVIREVAGGGELAFAADSDVREALARAIETAAFEGNALEVAAQRAAVGKLGARFVLEEIRGVIEARGLADREAYRAAARPGRQRALTRTQRDAVWRVAEGFRSELAARGKTTWEDLRIRARDRVRSGAVAPRYDGVLIDEAQDLPATTLAVLAGLCRSRGGLFLTADANQSIYGSAFRWKDVHEHLSFQGSTATLRANHRSTREVGEAAEAYLADGRSAETALDVERPTPTYVHEGAVPAVRAVDRGDDEAKLLARFFRGAARDLRLGLGACAALVPTNAAAVAIADELRLLGLDAAKVDARDLDLDAPGVKVLTQKSAKGLEFPIVALAGFAGSGLPDGDEAVSESRRAMYVAMTRAMRALLVIVPAQGETPLLSGFAPPAWNVG